MLAQILLAFLLLAFCVSIHALGLSTAFRWMKRHKPSTRRPIWSGTWILIRVAGWAVLLHALQITAWAVSFILIDAIPDSPDAFYFSAVTYTTTGYGDIVLPSSWRLFGSIEALTGILMCGLSTGFFFVVFTRILGMRAEPE